MARLERIVERLELKEFQLRTLLDLTKAINNIVDRAELLALYEQIVRVELGITRLSLYERTVAQNEGNWQRILSFGNEGEPSVDVELAFDAFKDIQVIGSENAGSLGAFDVAVPVHHRDKPLAFLLIGDIDEEEQRMSPVVKHLNFIQTLTNLVVVAMENRRMAQQQLQQERDKRELELAAQMQQMLIPKDLPNNAQLQAAAWYQPHQLVGGDYYDLIALGDDRYLVCVADVSGKGIAAALLMSNFQATLQASASQASDLERLVHVLNERVFASARGERFITLFLGHIDLKERRMRFANAGHNDPLLYDGKRIVPLHDGSIALGMMPTLPFLRTGEVLLPDEGTLLCYTDGLVEQEDAQGRDFGTAPLERALNEFAHEGAARINSAVMSAFEAHRGGQAYLDDIALLTLRLA
ncbi:MAG: PP2C family protein-serine/threonine phosphatase [Flavobacteriales bacterium]|nr:PP2C family protein-serine/threonine phosphatase [Flavobacteriales bacterium]